jgi:hypothetical protein
MIQQLCTKSNKTWIWPHQSFISHPSISPFNYLFVTFIYLSDILPFSLSVCLSICPFVNLFCVCMFISPAVCPYACPTAQLCTCPTVQLCNCPTISLMGIHYSCLQKLNWKLLVETKTLAKNNRALVITIKGLYSTTLSSAFPSVLHSVLQDINNWVGSEPCL